MSLKTCLTLAANPSQPVCGGSKASYPHPKSSLPTRHPRPAFQDAPRPKSVPHCAQQPREEDHNSGLESGQSQFLWNVGTSVPPFRLGSTEAWGGRGLPGFSRE